MSYTHYSDEELLQLIIERDDKALETLYHRHAQVVYNLIARIVQEPTLADEVLQDTFWQLWTKAEAYRGDGTVTAWLYRIARNKSLDQLRRQQARPQPAYAATQEAEEALWTTISTPDGEVERIAERRWERQQVRQALGTIPDEQRLCLELAYFEGMSQNQIALHTNTPLGTIKTRMRMGLQKLRHILHAVSQ
ncbi:MAG: sigma-70 family RNA polymerase sigma factor [Ardenticatenales bacterium]|nr:sigma-70 family RNA polymerase sigma factor [Ardenticatenales bacterium]